MLMNTTATAQEINDELVSYYSDHFEKAIGPDENLINGIKLLSRYKQIKGHEFLGSNEFVSGSLVLNNKTYADVSIKYDIVNQNIVLRYTTSLQGLNYIVLHSSFITEFELDNKHFEKLYFPKTDTQFFQIVTNNSIKCLYFWNKTLEINPQSVQNYFEYSDQSKKTYLVIDNELKHYSGKISFINLFPKDLHKPIKKYINSHRIEIKNAPDESIIKLIEFCEGLIPQEVHL